MAKITYEIDSIGNLVLRQVDIDGRSRYTQVDYDFPNIASTFGWDMSDVQPENSELKCRHVYTDGTIACGGCGLPPSVFISAAYEWLKDNEGVEVEDPGYFDEEE